LFRFVLSATSSTQTRDTTPPFLLISPVTTRQLVT
jgi:hypothetical protein